MDLHTASSDLARPEATVHEGRRSGRFEWALAELAAAGEGTDRQVALADLHLWWALELDQVAGLRTRPGHDPAVAAEAARHRATAAEILADPALSDCRSAYLRLLSAVRADPADPAWGVDEPSDLHDRARYLVERAVGLVGLGKVRAASEVVARARDLLPGVDDSCLRRCALITAHRAELELGLPGAETAAGPVLRTIRALRRRRAAAATAAGLRAELPDLIRRRADLESLVSRDPLTGLANRLGSDDWFGRHRTGPVTVAMADLIDFKRINDTFGHLVGDDVLRRVGEALRDVGELVARHGGDEFVVVTTGPPDERALEAVIRGAVRGVDVTDLDLAWSLDCRVGTASAGPGRSCADLVARADRGLLRRKVAG